MITARRRSFLTAVLIFVAYMTACNSSKKINANVSVQSDSLIQRLMEARHGLFDSILLKKEDLNVQVIYTEIDRDLKGAVRFTDHFFNVDKDRYFYPASTVKFPVALLALQRLNELRKQGIDKHSTMITEAADAGQTIVYNDPSTPDGHPTIAHYIKKIFLVSDNDAFNRLYEFLGQEYINDRLHKMGYAEAQIIHRLDISLTEEQNRLTNPVRFIDSSGSTIYNQPTVNSQLVYAKRDTRLGNGYMKGDSLIHQPFDFSRKNRLSLQDLHSLMKSVIFPKHTPGKSRFDLGKDDYAFVYKYLSMYPRESDFPFYDSLEFPDTHAKMFRFNDDASGQSHGLRIFSKAGWAYGFLTDVAYIVDFENNIEFMVSATIYCNSDGIFNDDKYDFDTLGYPFFRQLGQVLYDYELTRKRTIVPDLSAFRLDYGK